MIPAGKKISDEFEFWPGFFGPLPPGKYAVRLSFPFEKWKFYALNLASFEVKEPERKRENELKPITEQKQGSKRLPGIWVGKWADEPVRLTLGPNNVVKIEAEMTTEEGIYSVDWTTFPVHLDLDFGKKGKVTTIIQLTEESLKIENIQPGEARPKIFTKNANKLKREEVKDTSKSPAIPSPNREGQR